jgi:hypothetical protein
MRNIIPIEKIETFNKMIIDNVTISLNNLDTNYCRVTVTFLSNNNSISDIVFLTKDQVDVWSDDDSILYEIVANKLDLTFTE